MIALIAGNEFIQRLHYTIAYHDMTLQDRHQCAYVRCHSFECISQIEQTPPAIFIKLSMSSCAVGTACCVVTYFIWLA